MIISVILIISLLGLDQIIKQLSIIFANPQSGDTLIKVLIPEVLEFHYLINTGASFGMMEGEQLFFSVFTILSLLFFGYLFLSVDFKKAKIYSITVSLLIAGALGNAIDRIFRGGGVVDMINMPVVNYILSFFNISPFIFNLADLYLNVAIVMFIIDIIFLEKKRVEVTNEEI